MRRGERAADAETGLAEQSLVLRSWRDEDGGDGTGLRQEAPRPFATLKTTSISDADLSKFPDNKSTALAAGAADGLDAPPKDVFKAALSLAPASRRRVQGIASVPSRDGPDLQRRLAEPARRACLRLEPVQLQYADTAPRFQIAVRGANRNGFNTPWTKDDCPDSSRLSPSKCADRERPSARACGPDRRGAFRINSFLRHVVGNEVAFAPYGNGSAPVPASPDRRWPCDHRLGLALQTKGRRMALDTQGDRPFDDAYGFTASRRCHVHAAHG